VLVREVDGATPGQVGTYVVHRSGGQTGEEFAIASTHGGEQVDRPLPPPRKLRRLLGATPPSSE
jgi:hypothetical protein